MAVEPASSSHDEGRPELLSASCEVSDIEQQSDGKKGTVLSTLQRVTESCKPWVWAPVTLANKITRALLWIAIAGGEMRFILGLPFLPMNSAHSLEQSN